MTRSTTVLTALTGLLLAGLVATGPAPATAAPPGHDVMPSQVPAAGTPGFPNGEVLGIAQVGSTMVVGGTFTQVTPSGGATRAASGIVAFGATSGQLVGGFAPVLNGTVEDVLPGPDPGTVYVAGRFTRVNNVAQSHVTLLDVATGQVVAGFTPPATNGRIETMALARGRLLVGGTFTTAGGQQHRGLAALDPRTGALDAMMGVDVSGHHNDSGSGAQGAVGVRDMEPNGDGTALAVIGNFKQADGLPRDQAVLIDLSGTTARVDPDWRTRRYEPYCYNGVFDSYMRGLSVSPDGSFFVVATTGGGNPGTLCDNIARFEFDATGDDVQPTWASAAGGDTLWGVEVTENAVYVGGHQRWMNNHQGQDSNGQGAVPRAGLSAHDPDSGVPLSWNPGRNPRGEAAYAIHATPDGLWVGSNTVWIGNRQWRRERLAFFPLAGGVAPHPETTPGLPGDVLLGGRETVDQGNVLHRVNAGGPTLPAIDGGPAWAADDQATSPLRNANSNAAAYDPVPSVDATVPASTPRQVFDTERWSPNDDPQMSWDLPVQAGLPIQVRLFLANRCTCTSAAGQRAFDVSLEGQVVLDDLDLVAAAGDQRGTMRSFDLTSDGNVDLDFSHVVENPLVNAIEVVRRDLPPPTQAGSSLTAVPFDGTTAGAPVATDTRGVDWTSIRGAFVVGDTLFTAQTDGYLHRRTFTEDATGPDQRVDPYNDPRWSNVDTGSGNTYRGRVPDFYGQLGSLTGLTYAGDRIYYTRTGDATLRWRWFNADSGIVGSETFTAGGDRSWSDTGGLFVDGDTMYVVSRSSGDLLAVPFEDGPHGQAVLVDDTVDWRARAVFVGPGSTAPPPVNEAPTARFTATCDELTCTVDGSTSSDPEGDLASYAWTFGDGGTATGPLASHSYAGDGTYTIRLEVTDGSGASDATTRQVTVAADPPPAVSDIAFRASASATGNLTSPRVTVPGSVVAGDQLVLVGTFVDGVTVSDPAGWTRVAGEQQRGMTSTVWTRTATAADAGRAVTTPASALVKFALTVSAYSGVDPSSPVAAVGSTTDRGTTQHTSPALTAAAGAWVLESWSDKSSSTTDWTAPAGATVREEAIGAGGGRITALLVDSSSGVPAGGVGGRTATTDAASNGLSWTVVLAPAP
ncbi:PKD domain-containing protein [Nocardioides sp. J2M5]|uniref:PKD domain-containing protein n=1 Tax=Nocardioides palaemonis TaxID=2829810 RepID=UPI001BA7DA46|nr:PKD domain-containing protein [Nocardioides palaemonis]MBS2938787.1 PKD domain-containing protein [Nocardioides palaemonis]